MKQLILISTVFLSLTACNHSNNSKQATAQKQPDKLSTQNAEKIAQSALYTGLSEVFDFQTTIKTVQSENENDSYQISITVKNKKTKGKISTVRFTTDFILDADSFTNNDVRSYTTGKNKNREVVDNDYGNFIVADFNFDGREDFAVKKGMGGNAGPLYNYFIQTKDTTFELNEFLSEKMILFPTSFNKSNKTLTGISHASAVSSDKTVYQFDTRTKKWQIVNQQIKKVN